MGYNAESLDKFYFFQVRSDVVSPSKHPGNQLKYQMHFCFKTRRNVTKKIISLFYLDNKIVYTNKTSGMNLKLNGG